MKKLLIYLNVAFLGFLPAVGLAASWCPPGTVKCRGVCVDLSNDPNNCGYCGVVCPTGDCDGFICMDTAQTPTTESDVWTYDLARVLTGEGYSNNNYDFGTFSIADIEDGDLRITVNMNPDSIYVFEETHVKTIALNYMEDSEFSTYTYTVDIIPSKVLNDEDNIKMGGYKNEFDLRVPNSAKIHPRYTQDFQFTFVFSAVDADGNDVDLEPEDLLNSVEGNDVLIALHLGGLETNIDGSDSAWVPFIDDDNTASPV